jgi:predicted enzyme related to lactoylglutathione lyase
MMEDLLQTAVNAEGGRRHSNASIDMKLEVIVIPVSDVDRAKEFYSRLGWRLDADVAGASGFRLIQFTPPGSGSSVQFGVNLTPATPGSAQGLLLAVSDIEGAHEQLVARGIKASESFTVQTELVADFWTSTSVSAAHTLSTSVTGRLFRSVIRTATAGCCRKSQRDFLGVSQATQHMRRCMTFPRQ